MLARRCVATAGNPVFVVFRRLTPLCFYSTQLRDIRGRGFWRDENNQRDFLNRIGHDLNVLDLSDWYNITRQQVTRAGGRGLFDYYTSLEEVLRKVYSHFPWDSSKFEEADRLRKGYKDVMRAMDKAEEQLGIKQPEDWYSVTLADLKQVGFPTSITKSRLAELLGKRYPDRKWDQLVLLKTKFSQQRRLERVVVSLFLDVDIKINARKEAGLVHPQTGEYLELDIYLPSLKLAFEYQEKHHYTSTEYAYRPLETIQESDKIKRELAERNGITVITVPPWWDNTASSVIASIKAARPDLLTNVAVTAKPISGELPKNFFAQEVDYVEGIGTPTNACFFTMANVNPENWWLFEKYDGVRGFWNPETKSFYSRTGRKFIFPQEIIDSMPDDIFLDGELWFGVDNFQEALKMASKGDLSSGIDWTKFKYMVFDIPTHMGSYSQRYSDMVKKLAQKRCKYVEIAPKVVCRDMEHLETFLQDVIDKGGEGIILRDPNAPYQPGRSPGYLKHKVFSKSNENQQLFRSNETNKTKQNADTNQLYKLNFYYKKFRDAEARIVRVEGHDRWECELPNGVTFMAGAGSSEFLKRCTPREGDIVSFKHRGFLEVSKKPKLPTIYRLRTDVTWDTVVKNWKEQKTTATVKSLRKHRDRRPRGFWMNIENRRKFFLELAAALKFDPTIARNWQKITTTHVLARKGGRLLGCYKGSVHKALQDTFPEHFQQQRQMDASS